MHIQNMNNYLKKYLGCQHLGACVDGVISIYAEPSQILMFWRGGF